MPDFDELLLTVRMRSGIRDPDEARLAISAVAGSLAACLDGPERARLPGHVPRGHVPQGLDLQGRDEEGSDLSLSVDGLVSEIARRTGWPTDRARYAARAVLSALAEHDPELRQAVVRKLPEAIDLFTPPGAPA